MALSDCLTQAQTIAMVNAWVTGLTTPLHFVLSTQAAPSPTPAGINMNNVTEVSGATWYSRAVASLQTPIIAADGSIYLQTQQNQMNYTGSSGAVTVQAVALVETISAVDTLIALQPLATPVVMAAVNNAVIEQNYINIQLSPYNSVAVPQ